MHQRRPRGAASSEPATPSPACRPMAALLDWLGSLRFVRALLGSSGGLSGGTGGASGDDPMARGRATRSPVSRHASVNTAGWLRSLRTSSTRLGSVAQAPRWRFIRFCRPSRRRLLVAGVRPPARSDAPHAAPAWCTSQARRPPREGCASEAAGRARLRAKFAGSRLAACEGAYSIGIRRGARRRRCGSSAHAAGTAPNDEAVSGGSRRPICKSCHRAMVSIGSRLPTRRSKLMTRP